MRCVTVGKEFHRLALTLAFWAAGFLRLVFVDDALVVAFFAVVDEALALPAVGAPACCCAVCAMSVIALWAMCWN